MPSAKPKKGDSKQRGRSRAGHADAIDQQLARYRSMRNFAVTAEPAGGSKGKKNLRASANQTADLPFVIQKHAATRLHYDFRLGWRGVLKSWAVAKGPSYYPGDKRLAVQVEDHPIEYGGFEGIIPKGQYGGGTVMLWDEGTWEPHGNADEGLEKGRLKFTLHGKKLHGDWALIRMGGKAANEKKSNWLLIKERDGKERGPEEPSVTYEEPDSVVTGRDLDAIAANQDHVWGAHGSQRKQLGEHPVHVEKAACAAKPDHVHDRDGTRITAPSAPRGAPKESLPAFVPPQLALQMSDPPTGEEWLHELKLDGYRIQAHIKRTASRSAAQVKLLTRTGLAWTHRMPDITRALSELPVKSALLDGEVAVFDEHGGTSFALLQAAFQEDKKQRLTYVVFDLLHLDGKNLRKLPLELRKDMLRRLLADTDPDVIRYSDHLGANGKEVFREACKLGAEGIVSKRRNAIYSSGRSGAWLKIKCVRQQEFVIGGFTPPSMGGGGIGALLLGYYRDGELIYAGRTGTGFTQKMRTDMRARLGKIRQARPAFAALPAGAANQAIWVQPRLVCEVRFATWTADNLVRQASFQGLREDKPAKEVKREMPVDRAAQENARDANEDRFFKKRKDEKTNARTPVNFVGAKRNSSSAPTDFPIPLTHPDKTVDSETKLSKRELADYFWAVRDHMLPFIAKRPLSVVRCPQGSTRPCFFQKHVVGNLPEGIEGIDIRGRSSGAIETCITISTALGLAGLAQMGVLEIHLWGSTNTAIEKPDMLIFDLDPDEAIRWKTLAESAREVRERLKQYKLESFLKTTGGKGLHVVAPIEPKHDWPTVKNFAQEFAVQMESENRQLYLTKMTKTARKGKIYIDYLRNDRGATSIAPYSPRARKGAPVAAPLAWKELDESRAPRFLVADFADWKDRLRRDPWKRVVDVRQSLDPNIVKKFTSARSSG